MDMQITNPLPLDLQIDFIKLIVTNRTTSEKMFIDLVDENQASSFTLAEFSFNHKMSLFFRIRELGPHQILGEFMIVIICLNI